MKWCSAGSGLLALPLLWLVACSEPHGVEAQIAAKIEQMQNAIESKSSGDFLQQVYSGFSTAKGHDKPWLQRTLMYYQLRHERITVVVSQLEIHQAQSGVVKANFNVALAGGKGLIPNQGGLYRIETDWRREQGDWRLVYARWSKP